MMKNRNSGKIYNDAKFIGQVIKNARLKAHLTQAQLAEIVGMSDKSIGYIENGNQFPLVKNFLHLIEVLNISLKDFGVRESVVTSENKEKLIKMIYSCTESKAKKYLEILEFVEHLYNEKN